MQKIIEGMSERLTGVGGVVGVVLGGSRARGEERPGSDWDLGVYYRGELDLTALQRLAGDAEVAGPGGWGPWVNGGAWLQVEGQAVDWILRDLDRVQRVWADCQEGRYEVGIQAGHPLGFWSPCYAGELALARVLADPAGELRELREQMQVYPEPLRRSLVDAAWESEFLVAAAAKGAKRGDVLYVGLCLSRAFGVLTQALAAADRRWYLNEKGALDAFAGPYAEDMRRLLAKVGHGGRDESTVARAGELVALVRRDLAQVV